MGIRRRHKKTTQFPNVDKLKDEVKKFGEDLGDEHIQSLRNIYDDITTIDERVDRLADYVTLGTSTSGDYLKIGIIDTSITAGYLGSGAVTTEKIADSACTWDKQDLGSGNISTSYLADSACTASKLNITEGVQFVLENRTSDPASPVAGQMWLRTDL